MGANKMEYFLNVMIKGFEGTFAVLKTDDEQEIKWPIKNLPDDVEIGKKVRLILSTEKTERESRDKLAKTVLNSILDG